TAAACLADRPPAARSRDPRMAAPRRDPPSHQGPRALLDGVVPGGNDRHGLRPLDRGQPGPRPRRCRGLHRLAAGTATLRKDRALDRLVVDLEEVAHLALPPVANEGDVLGVLVVAVVGGLVRELHGEAEPVVVLRAD